MPSVFRFAPSPNGYLHLGHAYSALLNFDSARAVGGKFLLRIEDIDAARCSVEFESAIYEDLAWLGLSWETPARRQSEHLAGYREAVERLSAQGLVYPAFESRAEIARLVAAREKLAPWPRDPDGAPLYPGAARTLSASERARRVAVGQPYALRLDMQAAIARTGGLSWTELDPAVARPRHLIEELRPGRMGVVIDEPHTPRVRCRADPHLAQASTRETRKLRAMPRTSRQTASGKRRKRPTAVSSRTVKKSGLMSRR